MDIGKKYFGSKKEMYDAMVPLTRELAAETGDATAVLANAAALLRLWMPDVSWTGFYLWKDGRLVLGPFQGKPAVAEIALGKGVCGTAATERKTQIVADVHACANHIACDASTASEIVVPILAGETVLGVIDIDSRTRARFDGEDAEGLSRVAEVLAEILRK